MTQRALAGEWSSPDLSGGCPKHSSWPQNPQYVLTPSHTASFTIDLAQQAESRVPIGIAVLICEVGVPLRAKILAKQVVAKTKYKSLQTQSLRFELQPAPPNHFYVVVPMTFEPGQLGSFQLTVTSSEDSRFSFVPLGDEPPPTALPQNTP